MSNSHNITLDTYKTLTKQEFIEGDEKMTSILTNWDEEMFYVPKIKKKYEQLVKK